MRANQQPSLDSRVCRKCGQRKEFEEFAVVYCQKSRGKQYRQHTCKQCAREIHAAGMRKSRSVDPERYRGHQRKHRAEYLEKCQRQKRESDLRRKIEALDAYGGQVCKCCGETEHSMLTLDHIHNDGKSHRDEINGGMGRARSVNIYVWARNNGFPEGLQVLCYNCNISKHRNKGVCAHQIKKGSETIP